MIEKLKAGLTVLKNDLGDTWNRCKIFILAVGALILALEFQKILTAFLVWMGQRELKNANKQDEALKTQENDLNTQADKLVKEAQELPSKDKPVSEDWYKKP